MLSARLDAVEAGQHHVQDDQVRAVLLGERDGGRAVVGLQRGEPFMLEVAGDDARPARPRRRRPGRSAAPPWGSSSGGASRHATCGHGSRWACRRRRCPGRCPRAAGAAARTPPRRSRRTPVAHRAWPGVSRPGASRLPRGAIRRTAAQMARPISAAQNSIIRLIAAQPPPFQPVLQFIMSVLLPCESRRVSVPQMEERSARGSRNGECPDLHRSFIGPERVLDRCR